MNVKINQEISIELMKRTDTLKIAENFTAK